LEPGKSVTAGDAAHITAASRNGARFDSSLTPDERRSYSNGIWLCVTHARIVDQDKSRYTVDVLRRWKADAEAEAQKNLGRPKVSGAIPSGTCESPQGDDRRVVEEFLVQYRKLLTQCRGYMLSQAIILNRITDLATWRGAQADGTLREFKRLSDSKAALLANPETMALIGSVGKVAKTIETLTLEPTQDDVRQRTAWKRWSDLLLQLPNHGPQDDTQVQNFKRVCSEFLDASLTAVATKQRLVEAAVQEWLTGPAVPIVGEGHTEPPSKDMS
jgi:hypothetical protein